MGAGRYRSSPALRPSPRSVTYGRTDASRPAARSCAHGGCLGSLSSGLRKRLPHKFRQTTTVDVTPPATSEQERRSDAERAADSRAWLSEKPAPNGNRWRSEKTGTGLLPGPAHATWKGLWEEATFASRERSRPHAGRRALDPKRSRDRIYPGCMKVPKLLLAVLAASLLVGASVSRALPDQKPGTVHYSWLLRWPEKGEGPVLRQGVQSPAWTDSTHPGS